MRYFSRPVEFRHQITKITVLFFLLFVSFYSLSKIFLFYSQFKFSAGLYYQSYFGTPEFPIPLSWSVILEENHVLIFVTGIIYLIVTSVVILTSLPKKIKKIFIGLYSVLNVFLIGIPFLFIFYPSITYFYFWYVYTYHFLQIAMVLLLIFPVFFFKIKNIEKKKVYSFLFFFFSFLLLLFVLNNLMLFAQKIGFSYQKILTYYTGNPNMMISPKTYSGLLETASYHWVGMGVFILIPSHLIAFFFKESVLKKLVFLSYFFIIGEITSNFIIFHIPGFVIIKMVYFWGLQVILLILAGLLFYGRKRIAEKI
jgi:hypothetical protein